MRRLTCASLLLAALASPPLAGEAPPVAAPPLAGEAAPKKKKEGRALPAPRLFNRREAKIGFTVASVGLSGVGAVDVYVTTDDGETWDKSAGDPLVMVPLDGPGRGTVNVSLPEDGVVYGFYLVVKSRAGLGEPAPRPGTKPQVRAEADTKQPLAELYQPQPDGSRADVLVLTWKAEDRNLAAEPISLEYSEDGKQWRPIGPKRLANTQRYNWKLPAKAPSKIHLKLTVRDKAGNVSVAQTSEPVLIDLARPRVTEVAFVE